MAAARVPNQLLAYGVTTSDSRPNAKPAVDWTPRLPRSIADFLTMLAGNPNRTGFLAATTAEIASLRDMDT